MKTSISRRRMMCVVAASSILPEIAAGQTRYLGQPMTIVVPFAPGGSADLYARSLGTELAFKLGRPVLVVNKPGAGGNVGAAEVARNGIDGRFLLYTTTSIAINQTLYPSTNGFKLFNDLMPVAIVAVMPHVLVTKKSLSVKSTGDLLASLRANPQRYNYSSAGPGTSAHLSAELFLRNTRTSAAHVPYRGGSQAVLAVVSEEVDFAMMASFQALPLLKTGRVNALPSQPPSARRPYLIFRPYSSKGSTSSRISGTGCSYRLK